MANYIQSGGAQTILNSSSSGPGAWFRVHPKIRNITVQAIGIAAGASIGSTVEIHASNDGVNQVATILGNITLNSSSTSASDGFTIDAHWDYIRAQVNSLTTGSMQVIASANIINQ